MLISHQHKFIFIHIGKTGGTALEKALCQHLDMDYEETKRDPQGIWWKHIWARYMKEKVGEKVWNDYFTFAFVRNPYDMILSLYSMYTQYPEYTNPEVHPRLYHPWNQYENFEHFILSMGEKSHEPDEKWSKQLKKLGADNQMQVWESLQNLQTSYLTESWKGLSGLGNILVDFVGRFEYLQEDFYTVCEKIGIPKLELPYHGSTKHKPYHEIYTEKMKKIVYKHSSMDIDRFGYAMTFFNQANYEAKDNELYQKMKSLTLSNESPDLLIAKKRIITAGDLGMQSDCSVINPGALYRNGEFHLICRGEPDEEVWFGDFLACQPKPLWCILDNDLRIKKSFPLNYEEFPLNSRPEDWRLFEYQGKLYTNHSSYIMVDRNQWIIRCRPCISEIDLERHRLKLCCMLEPPFDALNEEKNWSFFVFKKSLMCLYSFKPYIVLEIDLEKGTTYTIIEEDIEFPWYDKGGKFIGNSTNLIDWDDEHYILFVHDFLEPKYEQRNRAYMQYAVLINKTTLLPTSIINRPLIIGGKEQGRSSGVHYTSSLVNRDDGLYSFYGEGDTHTSVVIFNKNELTKLFTKHKLKV